jgi:GAF domain-containing protein
MLTFMSDLPQVLEDVAQSLQQAPGPGQTLESITGSAVHVVDGAEHAAISMSHGRKAIETVAATSDLSEQIDRAQYDTQQGPCLDALYDQALVRMTDDEAEERWPDFTERIRGMGIRSMLCVRLFMQGDDVAALNMYSSHADAFDPDDEDIARLLGTHAAVALAAARKMDQLEHKADNRDLIGQAKGILMERHDLDADTAFQVLAKASQDANLKLIDVARRVADRDR